MKVFTTYLLGMSQANCFKTHNKLTMYPLGKLPFTPSVTPAETDLGQKTKGELYLLFLDSYAVQALYTEGTGGNSIQLLTTTGVRGVRDVVEQQKTRNMRGKTRDVCGKHATYVTIRGTREVRDNAGEVGTIEGERELGNNTCW